MQSSLTGYWYLYVTVSKSWIFSEASLREPAEVYHYLLSWWWLSGSSLLNLFHSSPCNTSLFLLSTLIGQNGSSPLTFPGIHTTHGNSIILATLNDGHDGYFPAVLASLSLSSFKFSFPCSASGDKQVPWPSKHPREMSPFFINPIFRNESLWALYTPTAYLK